MTERHKDCSEITWIGYISIIRISKLISLLQISNISQIFIYIICLFCCPYKNLILEDNDQLFFFNYLLKTQQVFLILE